MKFLISELRILVNLVGDSPYFFSDFFDSRTDIPHSVLRGVSGHIINYIQSKILYHIAGAFL